MTTALDIMTRAAIIIHDENYKRWTRSEMLNWASEAQISVARNPGVYNRTVTLPLSKGTTQSLPEDGWALVTVRCNVAGDRPVSVVKVTTRDLLDSFCPMWRRMPEQPLVENYIYGTREPTEFAVFPPNDGTGAVEMVYMAIPAHFTSENDEVVVDDSYIPALVNYIVYRAYCKESEYSPGISNATAFFEAYQQELMTALSVRQNTTPNAALMKVVASSNRIPNAAVSANGGTE